jgi:hypothetical protein
LHLSTSGSAVVAAQVLAAVRRAIILMPIWRVQNTNRCCFCGSSTTADQIHIPKFLYVRCNSIGLNCSRRHFHFQAKLPFEIECTCAFWQKGTIWAKNCC